MRRLILILVVSALVAAVLAPAAPSQTVIPFKVIRTFPHPSSYANALTWDNGTIWLSYSAGPLEQYDPYTGTMIKTFPTPNTKPRGLAFDGMDLWIASWYLAPTPSIFQINPGTGAVIQSYVAPFTNGRSNGMAWDGATLWLTNEANQIYQIDALRWAVIGSITVPATSSYNPRDLAWDTRTNTLWAGYQSKGLIRKHNPLTGAVLEEFKSPYAGFQQGLTWDSSFLWATGGSTKLDVSQIDVTPPFLVMKGSLQGNTSIQFELTDAVNETGNLLVVGWSGSGTFPPIQIPGGPIPLAFDNFTVLGLQLLPFFSSTIDASGNALTPFFTWPTLPSGIPFWICGVTLGAQGVVSVTEAQKYVTQ
jgi:glutamine cyclotransferase